nr:Ribosomal protein S12 methylthiotransferase RimO [Candidatus Prometheoarchaeum syntrophicum]
MRVLIIDGYIDQPSCLGVPPFLAPLPRYIYGAIKKIKPSWEIDYITIDQIRKVLKDNYQNKASIGLNRLRENNIIILISGVSVPGKYLSGTPLRFSDIKHISNFFSESFKIICGPSTIFGIGEEGGKPSIPIERLENLENKWDLIVKGDSEIVLSTLLQNYENIFYNYEEIGNNPNMEKILQLKRENMEDILDFSVIGAELIIHHPNFSRFEGGNLICEIETFRGCPRYINGGCLFCVEPKKGPTAHRKIDSIVKEIESLYNKGVRHFRLGNQTDFYAFNHGLYENKRYPKPNPEAVESLLSKIRNSCPDIRTLHIDNVNALNFALYPKEAEKITRSIIKYCTEGNVAAIGIESVDSNVISMNNLKASADEILEALSVINKYGKFIGKNGNPAFLPGLNFIMGLPGETQESLNLNYQFLHKILKKNYWIRRINLRKFLIPAGFNPRLNKKIKNHLNKFASKYYKWKDTIRNEIDHPMLQKIYPVGRELKNVYAEKIDGNGTLLRQPGTYPITCFVPRKLDLKIKFNLMVVDHGFRSLNCLKTPIILNELSQRELEIIDGIGKKRAKAILLKRPINKKEWLEILPPEIWEKVTKLQPSLLSLI